MLIVLTWAGGEGGRPRGHVGHRLPRRAWFALALAVVALVRSAWFVAVVSSLIREEGGEEACSEGIDRGSMVGEWEGMRRWAVERERRAMGRTTTDVEATGHVRLR